MRRLKSVQHHPGRLRNALASIAVLLSFMPSNTPESKQKELDASLAEVNCPYIEKAIYDPGLVNFDNASGGREIYGVHELRDQYNFDMRAVALITDTNMGKREKTTLFVSESFFSGRRSQLSVLSHECQHAKDAYFGIVIGGIVVDHETASLLDLNLFKALLELRAYKAQLSLLEEDINNPVWKATAYTFLVHYSDFRSIRGGQSFAQILDAVPITLQDRLYQAMVIEFVPTVTHLIVAYPSLAKE